MQNLDNQTIMLAIAAVTALALFLQAIVLLAIFITLRKATRTLKEEVEDLRTAAMPIIYNTQELLKHVTPKIEETVADVAAVAHGLREQTAHVEITAKEILNRLRQQSSRVDAMFSSTLDSVDRAGVFLADSVSRPARQLSGLLASVKAAIESLRSYDPASRHAYSAENLHADSPEASEAPEAEEPFI